MASPGGSQTQAASATQWLLPLPKHKRGPAEPGPAPEGGRTEAGPAPEPRPAPRATKAPETTPTTSPSGSQSPGSGASKGQPSQPSGWIERLPAPVRKDQLQWHRKQRQEEAKACKRQRLAGDGRFPQEAIKAYMRRLQGVGEAHPEPAPEPKDPTKEAFEKLQAFETCVSCTRCTWTSQKSKGCRRCLGQFYHKCRLTRAALTWQRQLCHDLRIQTQPNLY